MTRAKLHEPIGAMLPLLAILALAAAPPPAPSQAPPPPPELDLPAPDVPPVQQANGGCAPEKLVRLVVRNISPGLSAGDPRAQPRVMYRKGPSLLRTEEQPDPSRNGAKALFIVAEPEVWTIDLSSRVGRHAVDPGPDFAVHAPILPPAADVAPLFRTLEFGCEAQFMAANAPASQRAVPWGDTTAALHVATVGDQSLAMLMDGRRGTPLLISYLRQGKAVWVVRYDEFRADLPDRPDLFMPPKGVRIEEAPPPAARPPSTPSRPPRRPPPQQPRLQPL